MNKITEEEISKILLSSPMVLPNNPSASGLKAENVKSLFYKFIRVFAAIINTHIEGLQNEARSLVNEHNGFDKAHGDIRAIIDNLIVRDNELGNAIASALEFHDASLKAHPWVSTEITELKNRVTDAYNLASGKSRIYPVKDAQEMLSGLSEGLNVGDKFVLSEQNVPDFILFEKDYQGTEAIPLSKEELQGGMMLEPGKSYACNGYLLVATESGIDTSLFARQSVLENVIAELLTKETKKELRQESAQTVVLTTDTEFNLGLRTSISLELPSVIPSEFEVIVNFRSGQVPTVFNAPSNIIFTQDDCFLGTLTPVANRIYEINIKNVGGVLIAKVGSADYEVIE